MKVRGLQQAGGGVTFLTGTPITNSLAEMWTMMRYLSPEVLREQGIEHFDAFAQAYADTELQLERSVTGAYRQVARLARYSNMPELMTLWREAVDPISAQQVREMTLPDLLDREGNRIGQAIIVESEVSDAQRAYYVKMAERAKHLKPPNQVQKGDDTLLSISTDGRHSTLDLRLRVKDAPDDPRSKINLCADEVAREHLLPENMRDKRTQVVFCDLGVPTGVGAKGFNLYDDLIGKLVDRGIPRSQIATRYDAKTDAQWEELQRKVNAGEVRVILGSRDRMGVGVNIQQRAVAAHQLDVTWRPDQMLQSDYRILRDGNEFGEKGIRIYRYVVPNSFDGFMYDKVGYKAKVIDQVNQGQVHAREIEDFAGDESFSFAQVQAVAAGDPRITELIKGKDQVQRLGMERSAHLNQRLGEEMEAREIEEVRLPELDDTIARLGAEVAFRDSHARPEGEKWEMVVDGTTYETRRDAGDALFRIGQDMVETGQRERMVGEHQGYQVWVGPGGLANTTRVGLFQPEARAEANELRDFGARWKRASAAVMVDAESSSFVRLENVLRRMDEDMETATAQRESLPGRAAELRYQGQKPWANQGRFDDLTRRVTQLQQEVGAEVAGGKGLSQMTWGQELPRAPTEGWTSAEAWNAADRMGRAEILQQAGLWGSPEYADRIAKMMMSRFEELPQEAQDLLRSPPPPEAGGLEPAVPPAPGPAGAPAGAEALPPEQIQAVIRTQLQEARGGITLEQISDRSGIPIEQLRAEVTRLKGEGLDFAGLTEQPAAGREGWGGRNRIVTRERAEQARRTLQGEEGITKLRSGGPTWDELVAMTELAVFHLEAGANEFVDWVKRMKDELPSETRPDLLERLWLRANVKYEGEKYLSRNLNMERIQTPDEMKDFLARMATDVEAAVADRTRGVVSWERTTAEAEELLGEWSRRDIKRIEKGRALNARQQMALRMVEMGEATRASELAEAYAQDPTPANMARAVEAMREAQLIHITARGTTSEIGRALNQQKIIIEARKLADMGQGGRALERLLKVLGDRELTEQMMRQFIEIPPEDVYGKMEFIKKQMRFTTRDKLFFWWVSSILSAPPTHIVNTVANAIFQAANVGVRVARGLVDIPIARIQKRPQEFYVQEALPAALATYRGLPNGLVMGLRTFLSGITPEEARKFEIRPFFELPGGAAMPVNWPTRMLGAADMVNKHMNMQGGLASLAMRDALKRGLRGEEAIDEAAEILQNPPEEMIAKAWEFANYTTFTDKPADLQRVFSRLREKAGIRYIVPFLQVPYKITARGFEWSPFGLARLRDPAVRRSAEASDVVAKALLGSLIVAAVTPLAMQGKITGPAPRSAAARDEFYRLNKEPWAIQVGDTWVSYRTLGPLGLPITMTAAFWDAFSEDNKAPTMQRIEEAMALIAANVLDQSYLQGVAAIVEALENPTAWRQRTLGNILTGFIWPSALLRRTAYALDPEVKDLAGQSEDTGSWAWLIEGTYNRIRSGLPIVSKGVPPRLNVFGRPSVRQGSKGWKAWIPERITTGTKDPVYLEAARVGIRPGFAGRSLRIGNEVVSLSPGQQRRYQMLYGESMYRALEQLFASRDYQGASDEAKLEYARRAVRYAQDWAREQFRLEEMTALAQGAGGMPGVQAGASP